ncbi:MAG: alpha/beta fold hydrolase [Acidobacteria bacterium]|nr:alpha/beta fold hydrolase [Acidobacteriota bacterium]
MIVERDGVALHVEVEGAGEPVILLHGHSLDLRVWDDLAPALGRAGYRAIRYDQRGHGRSASPPQGYRFGDHAADLDAVLGATGCSSAHVIGLSKGGGIAVECALRFPGRVRSLTLVGPLLPDFPLSAELHGSFKEFARRIRGEGVQAAVRGCWLSHPLMRSAAGLPGARERVEAMTLTFPAGEYFASVRDDADRDWKVVDRLGEIAVPTLVVSGDGDVPDFVAMAALAAERVPSSVLEIVPECGHLVPIERPRELAELVLAFLDTR